MPAAALIQRWVESFEEHTESVRVYRPENYKFPLARGRKEIEFRSDGAFSEWVIAPNDASRAICGRWNEVQPGMLRLEYVEFPYPTKVLEVIRLTMNILMFRERSLPGTLGRKDHKK